MALFINDTSITTMATFIASLRTFLIAGTGADPQWLDDNHVPGSGEWAVSQDDGIGGEVEVAFQWDTTSVGSLGIYQYHTGLGAGNYNSGGGTAPFDQDGDSGNGFAGTAQASLVTQRSVDLGDAMIQYWAFAGDVDVNESYVHVVVEATANIYRHFGWGVIEKYNDFTGGEYAYGHRHFNSSSNVAVQDRSTTLLDGRSRTGAGFAGELWNATIRLEGLPASPASGLWAVHMNSQTGGNSGNNWLLGQDRQGTPIDRIQCVGGWRSDAFARTLGQFRGAVTQGNISTYPIVTVNQDRNDSDAYNILGSMRDVRGINMRNFQAQDTVVIGSDTWHIFPTTTRGDVAPDLVNTTGWQGIMYKQN